jgi:hypothetical protein
MLRLLGTLIVALVPISAMALSEPGPLESPLRVSAVLCRSGKKVNLAETVRPGDLYSINRQFIRARMSRLGDQLVLQSPINRMGFEYATGRPPCPTGDVLIVIFNALQSNQISETN